MNQKYLYYPGCSLQHNAVAYRNSILTVAEKLGVDFSEVDDWNCCGATEYLSIDLIPAYALICRNLALAANQSTDGNQLVAPCSACYLNLSKANHILAKSPELAKTINTALNAGGLQYEPGSVDVRHLLHALIEDIGYEAIAKEVVRPLYGLKIAPYYGCLLVRPVYNGKFDDTDHPTSLDKLMKAIGTEVVDFSMKTQCCGGHMTQISEQVALSLIFKLLKNAVDNEADIIVTLCPMCQMNLDGYQEAINKRFGSSFNIPVLYFTQLIGLAFGATPEEVGVGKEFIDSLPTLGKISQEPQKAKRKSRKSKMALPMPSMLEEVVA